MIDIPQAHSALSPFLVLVLPTPPFGQYAICHASSGGARFWKASGGSTHSTVNICATGKWRSASRGKIRRLINIGHVWLLSVLHCCHAQLPYDGDAAKIGSGLTTRRLSLYAIEDPQQRSSSEYLPFRPHRSRRARRPTPTKEYLRCPAPEVSRDNGETDTTVRACSLRLRRSISISERSSALTLPYASTLQPAREHRSCVTSAAPISEGNVVGVPLVHLRIPCHT